MPIGAMLGRHLQFYRVTTASPAPPGVRFPMRTHRAQFSAPGINVIGHQFKPAGRKARRGSNHIAGHGHGARRFPSGGDQLTHKAVRVNVWFMSGFNPMQSTSSIPGPSSFGKSSLDVAKHGGEAPTAGEVVIRYGRTAR